MIRRVQSPHPPAKASALVLKLSRLAPLPGPDRTILESLLADAEQVAPHHDLVRIGEVASRSIVLLAGVACRYKLRSSGGRQITDFVLPGDLCDPRAALVRKLDHSVGTLSTCLVAKIPSERVETLCGTHPRIAEALQWCRLVEEATLREWLVNVGRRPAVERIAHLFCELIDRLQAVGLAADRSCDFPLTQEDLADATGLSVVHVNRVLQNLRNAGLIRLRSRRLSVLDWSRLVALAGYNADYLQPRGGDGNRFSD